MSVYSERERFVDYMLAVKTLPCCAAGLGPFCSGGIEADHAGRRGIGQKAHDATVIPLCSQHHRWRTDFAGPFRPWNQARMRAWLLEKIDETQAAMRARGVEVPGDVGPPV